MNKIAGPMAVLTGVALIIPALALFTMPHLPAWLAHDLMFSALTGLALAFWGGLEVRHRASRAEKLEEIHIRR
ncbi:MAG TPA: hypothetical protein VG309_02545 [Rhizomicrobium sp.]|jgi:hypothetical protein|nr:hypothetical protein [Rhizomicrobium sp.]